MKDLIGLFALLVGVMLLAAWLGKSDNLSNFIASQTAKKTVQEASPTPSSVPFSPMRVGNYNLNVETVQTPVERQVGLSKHTGLNPDTGMLFSFGKTSVRTSMWMKGMSFPLDIIWVKDNKVTQINAGVPIVAEGTPDNKIPLYVPNQPIDYVLEVAAGTAKLKGIKIGDPVILPSI